MTDSCLHQEPDAKCLSPPTPEQPETPWPARPGEAAAVSKHSAANPPGAT